MAEEGGNLGHTRLRPFVPLCKEDSLGHVTRILCQETLGLQAIKFGLVSTIKLEGTLYLVVPPLTEAVRKTSDFDRLYHQHHDAHLRGWL